MALTKKILKQRKQGIGGSDCAAILGFSPWKTPLDVYLDKIDDDITQNNNSDPIYWGNKLENIVIKEYEKRTGNKCIKPKGIIKNDKYSWLLANLDGLAIDKRIVVEAKTTRFFDNTWGKEGTDAIPMQYLLQCAQYCIICEKDVAHLAVLGAGSDFRIYVYERNAELEEIMLKETKKFWYENVTKGIPPDFVDTSEINKLFKKEIENKNIVADSNTLDLIDDYVEIQASLKALKDAHTEVQNKIKSYMTDSSMLIDEGESKLISWKSQKTKKIDTKLLKLRYPDLYKELLQESESRVFRVYI